MYKSKHIYYNNHSNSNIICYINQHIRGTQQNTSYQTLSATYNMFRDPISITENTTVNFDYNYNNQRSRVTYANSAKTKYYSEGMQVEVIKNNNDYKFITYIDGDPYSANIIYVKTQSSSGYYYLHRDNQGTILGISDSSGIMIEQRIFDPWGNLKQGSISFIERGYTGHEHFLEISLIHMNARLYDPVKKIFLTPDNVLQDPYNPQNYNKFGYCLNNPLKYTDPSGNEPITITVGAYFIAAGISALISSIFYVAQNAYNQQGFDWGGLGLSILQGAVSGAAAYGIGSAFTTASVVAALGKTGTIFAQAAAHGLSQATISGIFKGDFSNFGSDFAAGAVSSLVGSGISKLQIDNPALRKLSMYLGGAISGGLAASITGGDFLDGAATGLIVTALNHGLHDIFDPLTSEQQEQKNEKLVRLEHDKVKVTFDPGADNPVSEKTAEYFKKILDKAWEKGIKSVRVSSTTNHSRLTSSGKISNHHVDGGAKAFDFNYVNDVHVSPTNQYANVLQNIISNTPGFYENFGPFIMSKNVKNFSPSPRLIENHKSHIHVSTY